MNRAAAILALCGTLTAPAADWQTTLTPPTPGNFPPPRPLRATYKFGWGKFNAATADFDFSQNPEGLLQLDLNVRTEGAVRAMWRMDSKHTALCAPATLRPVSSRQTETYRKETLTTSLDFTPEGVARLRVAQPPDKNPPKTKTFEFPAVFDLNSALLFVRSQPLETGSVVRLVVYPATDPYLAEIEVLGREKVTVGKQPAQPAMKLAIKLRRISKKLELQQHTKFKRATAWLADDQDRMLLKIQAEVSVGSVWGELETIKFQ